MIGKAKWFTPRKFGWGLGLGTKESAMYVVGMIAAMLIAISLPMPFEAKLALSLAIVGFAMLDVLHIMTEVYAKLDEREQKHQAIAERNASFVAVVCLVAYIGYVLLAAYPGKPDTGLLALPIAMLVAMALAKGATLLYLERKG